MRRYKKELVFAIAFTIMTIFAFIQSRLIGSELIGVVFFGFIAAHSWYNYFKYRPRK